VPIPNGVRLRLRPPRLSDIDVVATPVVKLIPALFPCRCCTLPVVLLPSGKGAAGGVVLARCVVKERVRAAGSVGAAGHVVYERVRRRWRCSGCRSCCSGGHSPPLAVYAVAVRVALRANSRPFAVLFAARSCCLWKCNPCRWRCCRRPRVLPKSAIHATRGIEATGRVGLERLKSRVAVLKLPVVLAWSA